MYVFAVCEVHYNTLLKRELMVTFLDSENGFELEDEFTKLVGTTKPENTKTITQV